jgi:hypothetical protein
VLARSDAEGNFEFLDIDNGLFVFRAAKVGYAPGEKAAYGFDIPDRPKLETLPDGSRVLSPVTIPLLKMAALTGVVEDGGRPVPNAWVYLDTVSTDVPLRNFRIEFRPRQGLQTDQQGRLEPIAFDYSQSLSTAGTIRILSMLGLDQAGRIH